MRASRNDKFARVAAVQPASNKLESARKREALAPFPPDERSAKVSDELAWLLGAVVARNRYGEHLQVRRWYSSPEPDGFAASAHALGLLLPRKPGQSAAAHERLADPAEWLFLDVETTGLAGGTGTYAFLVGIAWWESGGLQLEQFFMRDYSEEHSLLLELSQRLGDRRVLVTFNGKSFDWPLLETRYLMTRAIAPRAPAAHLDLLHPARQLWQLRLGSVRLTELERHVLGPERLGWDRRDDIDSALIPQIYFDYLRGGAPEQLISVFRHNQMDVRGLAALATKIFALLAEPEAADKQIHALELYGLSRLLNRRGQASKARLLYERALAAGLPVPVDRTARRELARLTKRERDFARANVLWEELLQTASGAQVHTNNSATLNLSAAGRSPQATQGLEKHLIKHLSAELLRPDRVGTQNDGRKVGAHPLRSRQFSELESSLEAYEQLAIYYEHHARGYTRAAELVHEALAKLRSAPRLGSLEPGRYRRWQVRFERRLARLARKSRDLLLEPDFPEARGEARESNDKPE